ncbi:hypothetical protein FNF29_00315 [Cafeteria roenbergensis]|uniref:Uncharacterized protein n=1 Tax=Cafeteria roenbergensis TaxID=33653 RepID=A0A5A8D167_CAFRO|nr:hypothetical protein FNF29_00315 [Cafeteria roenbergensis]|eukprot:KAA0157741.1 hypothetical protein FNF29_00315 [Cafeteria roenbergensis]
MQASHAQALVQQELERQQARTASRAAVEAYVKKHRLDKRLQDAVNEVVQIRPEEPMQALEGVLSRQSAARTGLAVRVVIASQRTGTHVVRVTLVNHYAQCAKRLQEALEAPASREGAGAGVGGASGGSLLVCGTAAQADDALTGLDAESEAGAPPVHRAVRLAASFASLRALAAVGRRSPLQLLVEARTQAPGEAGPAAEAMEVSLLAGASEWAVSREALQAEEEARAAAAAAASDAKGGKKKAAAKSGKSAGKKGAKAEPEAEAPADELDDESADTDGPLQYDINAAAGPTGGAGARVGVEEGEARRAMREVVGSEGLRRLLLRAARALPVVALGDAFTDGDGDEAAQAAKLLPALGMSGAPALAVGAAGEEEGAGEAEDGAPSRRGALCACVDVGGAAAPASATDLLARLQAAAASGGRVALRADGCDAVDEALADVTVAAGVCLVFLGSPSGCAARAVAARLEGLSAADATIRPRSWDEILPVEA